MRSTPLLFSLLLLAPACGNAPADTPDAQQAPPDAAPPHGGSNKVTLTAKGTTFAAYRDGTGDWLTPTKQGDTYELDVTDDYTVVVACEDSFGSDTEMRQATFADGVAQSIDCANIDGTGPATVAVSGSMQQAGTVSMGHSEYQADTGPFDWSLDLVPGSYDLIAHDVDRIAVRTGLDVTGASTEPAIDLTQEGDAFTSATLTVTGASGDTVYSSLFLDTGGASASFPITAGTMQVPPASQVPTGATEEVDALSFSAAAVRYAAQPYTGGDATIAMPAVLTGITFADTADATAATWTALPDADEVAVSARVQSAGVMKQQVVTATRSWLAKTGVHKLAFDPSAPGFAPTWSLSLSAAHSTDFAVLVRNGAAMSVSDVSNGAAANLAAARKQLRRLRR